MSEIVSNFHDCDLDIKKNEIFLFPTEVRAHGEMLDTDEPGIEWTISNRFIRNLKLLEQLNPNRDVLIHMKTCGGFWEEGMAIYDAIKAHPTYVTIINYTHARSMSSIIFMAGNLRFMTPHSYFMFHMGTIFFYGTVKSAFSYIDFEKIVCQKQMLDIYCAALKEQGKYSRKSLAKIREILQFQMDRKEEVYLTAEEAVEWGFADGIYTGRNECDLFAYERKHKARG